MACRESPPSSSKFPPAGVCSSSSLSVSTGTGAALPLLVVDDREKRPLVFRRLPSVVGRLETGDYQISGAWYGFAVERKTVADLVRSLTWGRDRFFDEAARLARYRFRRLLVVGSRADVRFHRYLAEVSPSRVLGSVACLEVDYGLPAVWAVDEGEAAEMVEFWAVRFARKYPCGVSAASFASYAGDAMSAREG